MNFITTSTGRVFSWPISYSNGENFMNPVEMHFPTNVKISSTSCGHNFAIMIASQGYLYSYGDNFEGQLGLGDSIWREKPMLISKLVQVWFLFEF